MSTRTSSAEKRTKKKSKCQHIHHCNLILTNWFRSVDLDSSHVSSINSIICGTVIAYRGPGDIIAFSSNSRLSSIEIYNAISNCKLEENDTSEQISDKLCIKRVHFNMNFSRIKSKRKSKATMNHKKHTKNKKTKRMNRTWHPTLCSTLDYHYIYRIGGGDSFRGLFGESSKNVDVFNLHNLTRISLPNMQLPRANCSATILPPNIPYHNYINNDDRNMNENEHETPNYGQLYIEQKRTGKVKSPPTGMAALLTSSLEQKKMANKPAPLPSPSPSPPAPLPIANGSAAPIPGSGSVAGAPMAPPIMSSAPPPPISSIIPSPPMSAASASLSSITYGGRSNRNKGEKTNCDYPEYCLFVSGGIDGTKLHKKCEIFYPYETSWNDVLPMKQARCGHIAQYLGSTQWKHSLNGGNGDFSLLEINEWKDISDLTTKIFVCGGRREHGNGITSSECFDIEENKWSMCQRAPFTNHGYQSGAWWSTQQCVAMISDPFNNNNVALYRPDINKWQVIGGGNSANNFDDDNNCNNHLTHFYPLIGTLWLFNQEYLYVMGDDYKCKNLEIYDQRNDKWIPIGIKQQQNEHDTTIQQKSDMLLTLTKNKQFDAFSSIS